MTGRFRGSYTVTITPFTEDGKAIDLAAWRRFVDWQLAQGVPGLIILGTTGEFLTVSDGDLRDALHLRSAVARTATRASRGEAPDASDVDVINLYAATPDIPPALIGGTRQAGRTRARTGQALSELARQAVELFGPETIERFRECSADDCSIVFYDESRSNNRRWCSMQRCGNRAKVRTHRSKRA